MFGLGKKKPMMVMHYEGLSLAPNMPISFEVTHDEIILGNEHINRNDIKFCASMKEKDFMMKYHGNNNSSNKWYLVITMKDDSYIAVWEVTPKVVNTFTDLQYNKI